MSSEMQIAMYGILIVVVGVVGYYVGGKYPSIGKSMGAGIGVASGAVISGILYYSMKDKHESFMP